MADSEWGSLIYYGFLLLVIGAALLIEFSGRAGQMLRQAALWAVIFAGTALAFQLWSGRTQQQVVTPSGRIEIPISADGHFYLTALLNGEKIRLIVDTGASSIALGPKDAEKIGIETEDLAYIGTARTANGSVRSAPVRIKTFSVGTMTDHNVPAFVIDGDLDGSLLGMDYLRQFARVSFESDLLILER